VLEHARAVALRRFRPGIEISDPIDARHLLEDRFRGLEHEVFAMLCLDNRRRVIAYVELFRGTIDGASVHVREVVKAALKCNAASVIFAHNHPSGVAEPSQSDEQITRRLRDALALVDIDYVDHIIVAGEHSYSIEQHRLIREMSDASHPKRRRR
jgi:DNA repair protein RadC